MRQIMIAGNWKMNGSLSLIQEMLNTLTGQVSSSSCSVVICPPSPFLISLGSLLADTPFKIGAQNVHSKESGAYTGENSALFLKELEVSYCIVGHSERRAYFAESNADIHAKMERLFEVGVQPILCVGESLEQRESGEHESTVMEQLQEGLKGFTVEQLSQCVIAYEPVWAIGTGKTATPEQANSMHQVIRTQIKSLASENIAEAMQILYGGSVNAKNAETLLGQSDIDGALVGGASLKPNDFCTIIQAGS